MYTAYHMYAEFAKQSVVVLIVAAAYPLYQYYDLQASLETISEIATLKY